MATNEATTPGISESSLHLLTEAAAAFLRISRAAGEVGFELRPISIMSGRTEKRLAEAIAEARRVCGEGKD